MWLSGPLILHFCGYGESTIQSVLQPLKTLNAQIATGMFYLSGTIQRLCIQNNEICWRLLEEFRENVPEQMLRSNAPINQRTLSWCSAKTHKSLIVLAPISSQTIPNQGINDLRFASLAGVSCILHCGSMWHNVTACGGVRRLKSASKCFFAANT